MAGSSRPRHARHAGPALSAPSHRPAGDAAGRVDHPATDDQSRPGRWDTALSGDGETEHGPVRWWSDRTWPCPAMIRQNTALSGDGQTEHGPVRRWRDRTRPCPAMERQNTALPGDGETEHGPVRRWSTVPAPVTTAERPDVQVPALDIRGDALRWRLRFSGVRAARERPEASGPASGVHAAVLPTPTRLWKWVSRAVVMN